MTAHDFAGFCKDVKTETYLDEEGRELTKEVLSEDGEPEYMYSLRYGEFIALNTFMIQKLYKENQNLRDENRDIKKRLLRLEELIKKQK